MQHSLLPPPPPAPIIWCPLSAFSFSYPFFCSCFVPGSSYFPSLLFLFFTPFLFLACLQLSSYSFPSLFNFIILNSMYVYSRKLGIMVDVPNCPHSENQDLSPKYELTVCSWYSRIFHYFSESRWCVFFLNVKQCSASTLCLGQRRLSDGDKPTPEWDFLLSFSFTQPWLQELFGTAGK